ncbi:peptidylprolyl isomerase [candidate division KSB1 bacterium]|nr:peptidylprolyl isomerase [candidate division KSB1 bacterium]
MMKKRIFTWYWLLLLGLVSCGGPELNDETVAIVGQEKITRDALVTSYELFPHWAPALKGEAALQAHLEVLIQKQLFAQAGRRRGYATAPEIVRIVNWYRDQELRRALYRNEVANQIRITTADLKTAYQKENVQLHVRHLFARTEAQLQVMQQALAQGVAWEEVAAVIFQDSLLARNGGDLGWLGFGQMEETFEDSAYALRIGQISQPVRTRYGYHLIQVQNVRTNVLTSEADFVAQKATLTRALTRRLEKKYAADFIHRFMTPKKVTLLNRTFDLLVAKIRDQVIDNRSPETLAFPTLKDVELNTLSAGLEAYTKEVLITFTGGQWTIGDFLARLQNLPAHQRPRLDSPAKFRLDLGIMLRNEFLVQEARRQGLEKDAEVQAEVKRWEDDYIFSYFWQTIEDSIQVPEEAAQTFYDQHRSRYWQPEQVHVREILVRTLAEATALGKALKQGADFAQLAREKSLRKGIAEKGGDLGWLGRGQMGDIATVAFQMKPGAISQPIPVAGGFSIIQVLAKQAQREKTFTEAQNLVEQELRHDLSSQRYQHWVEQLKLKSRIKINAPLLKTLSRELTTTNRVVMPGLRQGGK